MRHSTCSKSSLLVVGGTTLLVEIERNKSETSGRLAKAVSFILESFCQDALRAMLIYKIHGHHVLHKLQHGASNQNICCKVTLFKKTLAFSRADHRSVLRLQWPVFITVKTMYSCTRHIIGMCSTLQAACKVLHMSIQRTMQGVSQCVAVTHCLSSTLCPTCKVAPFLMRKIHRTGSQPSLQTDTQR